MSRRTSRRITPRPVTPRPIITRWANPAWLVATGIATGPGCASVDADPTRPTSAGDGGGDVVDLSPGSVGSGATEGQPAAVELAPQSLEQLELALSRDAAPSLDALRERHAVPFEETLDYEPLEAAGLDRLQASSLSLTPSELVSLGANGFAIVPRKEFPTFSYGYQTIYMEDLPVFVSADMVLEALHRSYDDMLAALERGVLAERLATMLDGMAQQLAAGTLASSPQLERDLDLYLTVPRALLAGGAQPPLAGDWAAAEPLVDAAGRAAGIETVVLFGEPREIDFSQFAPRGHYADGAGLEFYFRAMTWLGRVDLRLVETQSSGERVFRRRQLEAALGLRELMTEETRQNHADIDRAITAFVGEHDYMVSSQLDGLLSDLGVSTREDIASLSDNAIAQTIVDRRYGGQRIASHVIRRAPGGDTFPLNASFALLGQRYLVDSHVLSNLVYDRLPTRVLPDPLDAAFAVLDNDQAVELLATELEDHDYARELSEQRILVEAHGDDYWSQDLVTGWLGALRALSPRALSEGGASDLPSVARGEAWGRRMLSTQLASWSQMRHDTLLYAKQSYTSGALCEFPDAYVEPYPEFFRRVGQLGELGQSVAADLGLQAEDDFFGQLVSDYFSRLVEVSTILTRMAEAQRTGAPHAPGDLAFINQAVSIENGCAGPSHQAGWYSELFFSPTSGLELAPTIADVHTDVGGQYPVLREPSVLHVGTGLPRLIVVTVNTCSGPRAYAGMAHAYHQHLAPGIDRLNDEEWLRMLEAGDAQDPFWLAPALAR